jgi:hypothetical protein
MLASAVLHGTDVVTVPPPPAILIAGFAAAEIDDHINRGRNMDTRTPTSQCSFVT